MSEFTAEQEAWVRAWAATTNANDCKSVTTATNFANTCLKEFREVFKDSIKSDKEEVRELRTQRDAASLETLKTKKALAELHEHYLTAQKENVLSTYRLEDANKKFAMLQEASKNLQKDRDDFYNSYQECTVNYNKKTLEIVALEEAVAEKQEALEVYAKENQALRAENHELKEEVRELREERDGVHHSEIDDYTPDICVKGQANNKQTNPQEI